MAVGDVAYSPLYSSLRAENRTTNSVRGGDKMKVESRVACAVQAWLQQTSASCERDVGMSR